MSSFFSVRRRSSAVILVVLTVVALTCTPSALAKGPTKATAAENKPAPLLPTDFAGWHETAPEKSGTDPNAADQANAPVLKEFGLTRWANAEYTRDDGKLEVRALAFPDASGAYGAYTFYTRPGMTDASIGKAAAFDGSRVLFWIGTTVVDAKFDKITATSAGELREMAQDLPSAAGSKGLLPSLPRYLPQQGLVPNSTRYDLGPEGYTRGGGVLPASLVDFNRGAEAVTAEYSSHDGDGALTVIDYPTPQIAAERQRAIAAFLAAGPGPQAAWPDALAESGKQALLTRHSGPLVIVTSGNLGGAQAKQLLNAVNYQADITWNNPKGYVSEGNKAARLLVGVITLFLILGGAAVVMGIFFGGGRALIRKMRGKPISSLEEEAFISLKLK